MYQRGARSAMLGQCGGEEGMGKDGWQDLITLAVSGELCCGGGIPPGLVGAPVDSEWGKRLLKGTTLAAVSDWKVSRSQGEEVAGLWGTVGKDRRVDLRATFR